MVKEHLDLENNFEAGRILGGFFTRYKKKFVAYFLITYVCEGKLKKIVESSESEKSKFRGCLI